MEVEGSNTNEISKVTVSKLIALRTIKFIALLIILSKTHYKVRWNDYLMCM